MTTPGRSACLAALAWLAGGAFAPAAAEEHSNADLEAFIRLSCIDEPGREDLDLSLAFPGQVSAEDPAVRAFVADYGERSGYLHYWRSGDGRTTNEEHSVVPLAAVEISRRRMTLLFDCGREADCILASGARGGRTRRLGIACHSPHLVFEMLEDWMNRNVERSTPMNPSIPREMSR